MININYLLAFCFAAITTVLLGAFVIPMLKKLRAKQPIYKYVETHKEKQGTPTMGGLFFIIPAAIISIIFCGLKERVFVFAVVIGVAFMVVGFLDDFIKIRLKHNQGLKAYQKIIFQLLISVFAGVFVYKNGLTVVNIPFTDFSFDLKIYSIPITVVVFIAITNCVNLTDGLDGLAGSTGAVSLAIFGFIILLQTTVLTESFARSDGLKNLSVLSFSLAGALFGFLVYNVNKAQVFMGDTGSLSLGGFIGAIAIFSGNTFFIPVVGIMFVISGISVIIQVLYYKKTKKRVFLMAPLHHHLQMKGKTETSIAYLYVFITVILGVLSIIKYV